MVGGDGAAPPSDTRAEALKPQGAVGQPGDEPRPVSLRSPAGSRRLGVCERCLSAMVQLAARLQGFLLTHNQGLQPRLPGPQGESVIAMGPAGGERPAPRKGASAAERSDRRGHTVEVGWRPGGARGKGGNSPRDARKVDLLAAHNRR